MEFKDTLLDFVIVHNSAPKGQNLVLVVSTQELNGLHHFVPTGSDAMLANHNRTVTLECRCQLRVALLGFSAALS